MTNRRDSNVNNGFSQTSDNRNILCINGQTYFTEQATIFVEGDPDLGESDYEARWAEFVRALSHDGGKIKTIFSADSTEYIVTNSDFFLLCDDTGASININLPPAADFYDAVNGIGYALIIKKTGINGTSVTIVPDGDELIDNLTEKEISAQFVAYKLRSNGTQWSFEV